MTKYLDYNKVQNTPFVDFNIVSTKNDKGAWFKLYTSKNSGTYGYQVHFEGNDYNKEDGYFSGKTGGCGYCKEASALNNILSQLGFTAPTCHYETRHLFSMHTEKGNKSLHLGGNYFSGTRPQMNKFLKLAK